MTPAGRLAAAIEVLEAIEESGRPADQVASFYFKSRRYIGAKDRRAVTETVWRVLRRKARLNWWLTQFSPHLMDARARVLADMVIDGGPLPEDEMFQGPHACPRPDAEDRKVLERLRQEPLFHRDQPNWVRGEYPEWLEPKLTAVYGDTLPGQMGAMREEASIDLRVNTLKADRPKAVAALAAQGVETTPTKLSPIGLRLSKRMALVELLAWRDGLIEVQDEGSQLVALMADAKPGMTVIDYCSGAGGKTLALAAAMENKGRIVACDVAEWRVDRAGPRLRRANVNNVTRRVISGETDKWIKRNAASFDRVLVDAPCSGSGTWRRNPDAKWQMTQNDLDEVTASQATILKSASRLVKPGGRMIYATCSILPEENEAQIDRFLAENPNFTALPIPEVWAEVNPTIPCPVPGPWLRLSPLEHGTDGFFAAVLVRAAAAQSPPSQAPSQD